MKKKVFKNVWLRVAMIVAVVTTAFAGTAQAADELYKTVLFAAENCSAVVKPEQGTTRWTASNEGFTVSLLNFNNAKNKNNWYGYAHLLDNGATITSVFPVDKIVSKVELVFNGDPSGVTSIKLFKSANHSDWTEVGEFTSDNNWTATIQPANYAANMYYELVFNTEGNPTVNVSQIKFYSYWNSNAVHTPVISGETKFQTSTTVTISCQTEGATILYSKDNGLNWTEYPTDGISLNETTTIKAKATKANMVESPIATKSFSLAADAENVTWNLKAAPTGIHDQTDIATWTNDASGQPTNAIMTLSKGTSNEDIAAPDATSGTKFGVGQILQFDPVPGYAITSITFTVRKEGHDYAGYTSGWQNATASASGKTVTVTPEDGTSTVEITIGTASWPSYATGVAVECTPTSSPYIAADAETVTLAAATTGTIEVVYNRIDASNLVSDPAFQLCDVEGNALAEGVGYDWLDASLDENGNIAYSIEANEGEARTAYMKVTATINKKNTVVVVVSNVIALKQESNTPSEVIPVTISAAGYSSLYYGTKNLIVPEGVTALTYKVDETGANMLAVSHTYEAGDVIPAGTGVVIKGQGSFEFGVTTADGTADADNLLKGFDEAGQTTVGDNDYTEYYFFALSLNASNDPNSAGFYWKNSTGEAFTATAHKIYLALPKSMFDETGNPVKGYAFDGDNATAIQTIESAVENGAIYNLAGQRLQKMQKGISIVNGKKILK